MCSFVAEHLTTFLTNMKKANTDDVNYFFDRMLSEKPLQRNTICYSYPTITFMFINNGSIKDMH